MVADARLAADQAPPLTSAAPRPGNRLHDSLSAGAGILAGNALGVLLPFALTAQFATAAETDVYFLVFGGANLAASFVQMLQASVLVFTADALRSRGGDPVQVALGLGRYAMLVAVPVTLGFAALVVVVLVPAAAFDAVQERLALDVLVALLPLPLFTAASCVLTGVHFACGRFAWPAASHGLRAGGGLVAVLLVGPGGSVAAVAAGVTVGEALRCLALAIGLRRSPARGGAGAVSREQGRQFLRLALPTVASNGIAAVNPVIDKAVASRLGTGATTSVELAEKLFFVPMTLLITTISTVSGVAWSRLAAERDEDGLRRDYRSVHTVSAVVTTVLTVVAVAVIVAVGDVVAETLNVPDPEVFTTLLVLYMVGLPLAMAAELGGRMLISLRRSGAFPAVAAVLVAANLVLDLVGASLFGVVGIAAASSLVRALHAVLFVWLSLSALRARRS